MESPGELARPATLEAPGAPAAQASTPVASAPEPVARITLPEEVVIQVLGVGQPAFLRCWARAQRNDPVVGAKVRLHIEIDAAGKVTASDNDSESPVLSRCLAVVARQLPFPPAGVPAVVDLPLIFQ